MIDYMAIYSVFFSILAHSEMACDITYQAGLVPQANRVRLWPPECQVVREALEVRGWEG